MSEVFDGVDNNPINGADQPAPIGCGKNNYAKLLTRLAALKGQAVPLYRFSMVEVSSTGVELDTLPAQDQLIEMWISRFRNGVVKAVNINRVDKNSFPLLAVSQYTGEAFLLKGKLSGGFFVTEGSDGAVYERRIDINDALVLNFSFSSTEDNLSYKKPQTATEWFFHVLKKRKKIFFESIIATFVISFLAIFTSLYSMQIYDRVIPTQGFKTLWVLTIGVAISIFFEFLQKQARSHLVERASKNIDMELSDVFFSKAVDIRMDARPNTVGTFASQIRHFESVRSFLTASVLFILADVPFAIFFIIVIALLAGPVALVPVVMIPIAVLVGFLSSRKMKLYSSKQMAESNQKNGLLIEVVDGAESIKASGADWKFKDLHRKLTVSIAENNLKLRNISVRSSNLTQMLQQVNYVGLVAAGAYSVASGHLTMGGLIACSIISGRAFGPVLQIPQLISQWSSAKIALDALDNIMALPSDREEGVRLVVPDLCKGKILLEQMKFGYSEQQSVIEADSLAFSPGERVAIVGSVGSGKSTLIKVISGLYKPTAGTIYLDGVDLNQIAPDFIRENIGYLPQDVRLFNGTLRENLTLGLPTPSDSMIMNAASVTGLDKVISNNSQGLELMISEGGKGLSGGQRQLVGLTRLLLMKPKIMLLDEPTASMDTALESHVMKHLFNELPRDSMILVVTHKTSVLSLVGRVVVVNNAKVVLDDTRDKVISMTQSKMASK